jgi:hypothetical protein
VNPSQQMARFRVAPHAASPPGSSRRAGGYSPVLRLTADEMSLRLIPLSQKVHLLGHDSTAEGDILGQGPRRPARGRPKAVFLLLACCTQEEDLVTQ